MKCFPCFGSSSDGDKEDSEDSGRKSAGSVKFLPPFLSHCCDFTRACVLGFCEKFLSIYELCSFLVNLGRNLWFECWNELVFLSSPIISPTVEFDGIAMVEGGIALCI